MYMKTMLLPPIQGVLLTVFQCGRAMGTAFGAAMSAFASQSPAQLVKRA